MPLKFTVCCPAPSLMVRLLNAFNVGGWFTALTVTVNVRVIILLLAPPSLTVTVIVADPKPSATGVNRNVPVAFGLV